MTFKTNLVKQKRRVWSSAAHRVEGFRRPAAVLQALWGSATVHFLRLGTRVIWASGMDFTFTERSRNPFFCMVKNNKLGKCHQITFY